MTIVLQEYALSPFVLVTTVVGGILLSIGAYKLSTSQTRNVKTVPYVSVGMLKAMNELSGVNAPIFLLELARQQRQNGGRKCFRVMMPMPFAMYGVGDPELARKILSDPLSDKPIFAYSPFHAIFGSDNSILTSPSNSHWKLVRKTTAPAFSTSEISRMKDIAVKCAQEWCDYAEKNYLNATLDPVIEMVKLTFHIICRAGFEYESTDEDFHDMHRSFAKALPEYSQKRQTYPLRFLVAWLLPEARVAANCCQKIQGFAAKMLRSYQENPNKSKQNTLIKLIASNESLSERQKVAEIVVFIMAGHDTSGVAIANTLVLLGRHPDILKKLWNDTEGLVPSQWSTSSTYYKYVVKETQRIMPTIAMGSVRTLGQDYDTGINGELMLKGSIAICNQITPLYDDTIFEDPDVFNPDRWYHATPNMENSLLPFAVGPRNCIGQALGIAEIDTILPAILSQFDIVLVEHGKLEFFLTWKYIGAQVQLRRR